VQPRYIDPIPSRRPVLPKANCLSAAIRACLGPDSLLAARHPRGSLVDSAAFFGFFKASTALSAGSDLSLGKVLLFMQIMVRDNNVDQALRALKKKLQREGVYREMKLRRHYEKPSEKRAREKAAAVRRARKMERKRMERDGIK
jgi:small subunit ribosomal protein S21